MSIKAAKGELTTLLAEGGDDNLVSFKRPRTMQRPEPDAGSSADAAQRSNQTATADTSNHVHETGPASDSATTKTIVPPRGETVPSGEAQALSKSDRLQTSSPSLEPEGTSAAPATAEQKKNYRSQGIVIYDSDIELVDGFSAYLRRNKIRAGRRGFSLFARAGLRALEQLRLSDPAGFEAMLVRANQEQS
jgi:hypothetical protein